MMSKNTAMSRSHPGIIFTVSVVLLMMVGSTREVQAQADSPPPEPRPDERSEEVRELHLSTVVPAGPELYVGVLPHDLDTGVSALALDPTEGTWNAQGPGPTTNAQVQNLSPNNEVAGGIHAVVAHPTDADILYIGAVNGGVWRTMNATAPSPSWTQLTDFQQSLSIGALEMDAGNSMILLAGIGRFSSFGGDPPFQIGGGDLSGLLRTTDGGNTWTPIMDPLLVGEHISCVASRGSTLLAGANDFFGGGGTGGLFRSPDTGANWNQISGGVGTGLPAGTVDDMAGDPSSASRLYLALQGNGIYRSDDTGANWNQVSNNDATLNAAMLGATNTRIAVAADARVFALVTSGSTGITSYIGYSDNQGGSWTQMDVPGTTETALQGRDQLMGLVVDPSDSDIVYVSAITQRSPFVNSVGASSFHAHMFRGDVTLARGIVSNVSSQWDHLTHQAGAGGMANGGTASTSSPHADSREMTFDANGNLIEVDDGGVNRRTSPGDNTGDWSSINGDIQVTELHSIAYDTNFDLIIGGTQDTGAVEQSATGSTTWNTVLVADGGQVEVDDSVAGTSIRYYSQQRLGNFTRRTCNGGCADVMPALAGGVPALVPGTGGNVQFYTPIELNTADPTRLIIGAANNVYESTDQGNTVSTIPAAGGVNIGANSDAAMVCGHANNAELIYLGAGSRVFVRTAAGGNLTPTTAAFPGGMIFGVAVDSADEDTLYVIGNTSVYQSDDGGDGWTNITGDIGDEGAGTFRGIAFIPSVPNDRIAVATNAGVYITFEGSLGTWFRLGSGLPNTPVWDLDYDATDDVLVAGTLGRGAWTIANASTLNAPPVAICQDVTADADDMCLAQVKPAEVDDGSFDPEGGVNQLSLSPMGPYMLGDTSVTLTVEDDGGLTATCEATVTVVDVTPPDINCPADVILTCGESTDPSNTGSATATDNCDPAPVIDSGDIVIPTPCPADPIQEVIQRTWKATDFSGNENSCLQTITVLKLGKDLDIKPGSCPNGHNPLRNGRLPVTLAGTSAFDVTTVDLSTVLISRADCVGGAVAPIRDHYNDPATPFPGDTCDCHELRGDGVVDLSLKFRQRAVSETLDLDEFSHGDSVELVLSGALADGCEFIAADCISIRAAGKP